MNNNRKEMGLVASLREYIEDELRDSLYYEELSQLAPTKRARDLLLEFSSDERMHAENFMRAYRIVTGRGYTPPRIEPPEIPRYDEALKQRIIAETNDYKKYGEWYLRIPDPYLRMLFFETRTDEARHAMRIPILMEEEMENHSNHYMPASNQPLSSLIR